tara:strand:+ start:17977 stop:19860 length:1884 start_codon:yes stop_codon:yes gene_type:complete
MGGGNDKVVDLRPTELEVIGQQSYQPGEWLEVAFAIEAKNIEPDSIVGVHFYLVHDRDDDSSDVELKVEHSVLAAMTFTDVVTVGINHYTESFQIPAEIPVGGRYFVIGVVDPLNEYAEDIESNNFPTADFEDEHGYPFPVAVIEITASSKHDLALKAVEFSGDVVVLTRPEDFLEDGRSEHAAEVIGHVDSQYDGYGSGDSYLSAELLLNGVYQTVRLWEVDSQQYLDRIPVAHTIKHSPIAVGIDVNLSLDQLQLLMSGYDEGVDNYLHFRFTALSADDLPAYANTEEDIAENNILTIEVPYYFLPPVVEQSESLPISEASFLALQANAVAPIESENEELVRENFGSWDENFGKKSIVAAGIIMAQYATIDNVSDGEKAASIFSDVGLNVWALDSDPVEFMIARWSASTVKGGTIDYAEMRASLLFHGLTIYSLPIDVPPTFVPISVVDKKWEDSESLATGIIYIGIVPIELKLLVDAQLGAGISVENTGQELIVSGTSPAAELLLVGQARVSVLGVKVGPQVAGGILSAGFFSNAKAGFEPDSDNARALFEVKPHIKAIYMKVGVYIEVSKFEWCTVWWSPLPYPCGIKENDRTDFWLYESDGALYDKEWTLIEKEAVLLVPNH